MKKTLSLIIALTLALSAFTACSGDSTDGTNAPKETRPVADTTPYESAESFAGGSGTESDPFQISEVGHLVLLNKMLEKEEKETNFDDTYVKGHYVLTADISLNDTSDFANWSKTAPKYGWTPIGANVKSNSFAGVFDGANHKITGMFIDAVGTATSNFGLFSKLSEATVKNLTVEQSYIRLSGDGACGTIAGNNFKSSIENCKVNSVIELYNAIDAGGISGNNGIISNCTYAGTITQLDDNFSHIGGIVGDGDDVISNCEFTGTLTGKGYTGGIVGYGKAVENCTNKGTVTGETAGGIIGRIYEAGTDLELEVTQYTVKNCINEGKVNAKTLAGGIVGWFGNDESDISITVSGCENKGELTSEDSAAGIIAKLSVERSGLITIENCTNNVDISARNQVGGIIGAIHGGVVNQCGKAVVSGCKNLGNITAEEQDAAGIVSYMLILGNTTDLELTLDNCSNEGNVSAKNYAGGVIGFSNVGFNASTNESLNVSENTKLTINKCTNSGKIVTTTYNTMAGGIISVLGLGNIKTEIKDCVNTGEVAIEFTLTDEQIADLQGSDWTTIHQIAGGIVGRIGDALKLTVAETEKQSESNINTPDGKIQITGCQSTGKITAPDYSFILNKWEKPLFVNYLGGIVGQCSATDFYAFGTENCTYSNTDRGFGDVSYNDFGTKN